MKLSVVTTMYYSAPYIEEFYQRIKQEAEKITKNYEIIFVNDGSPDHSVDLAITLHKKDRHVKVVDLSRNFGHHKAMMTGLAHAGGDLVLLIDCDLEEVPELLGEFYRKMQETGADVVYGKRSKREGSFFSRMCSKIFWKFFNWISSYVVPANQFTARLMTQRYVSSLVAHKDQEIFLPGLFAIAGYHQVPLIFDKTCKGTSTYTFRKKVAQFVDSLTSFSNKPLVFIFYLGSLIVLVSGVDALYLIIKKIFFDSALAGWSSIIVSIWLLGGLTIFSLGVIGIYLSKIFTETKQRPLTVVKAIHGMIIDKAPIQKGR